jgi:hypothetical protein
VAGRKAATQIEQPRTVPVLAQRGEDAGGSVDRGDPTFGFALLRADVKGDPGRLQAEFGGQVENREDLGRVGAELAGQRPVRAGSRGGQPGQQGGAGRFGGYLAGLVHAVDHEGVDAGGVVVANRRARLHRVRRQQPRGVCARREDCVGLGRARHVEAAAGLGYRRQHGGVRVRLDRVVQGDVTQRGAERAVVAGDRARAE